MVTENWQSVHLGDIWYFWSGCSDFYSLDTRDKARHTTAVPRHPGPGGVEDALLAREVDAALHAGPHAVQEGGLDTRHGG